MVPTNSIVLEFQELSKGRILHMNIGGSIMHGTDNEHSDKDVYLIYAPPIDEVIIGNDLVNYNFVYENCDIQAYPVQYFFKRLNKTETIAVEIANSINSEFCIYKSSPWSGIISQNFSKMIDGNLASFIGSINSNIKRLLNPKNLSPDIDCESKRKFWKTASHTERLYIEALSIYSFGHVKFPFIESDKLLEIKNNFDNVDEYLKRIDFINSLDRYNGLVEINTISEKRSVECKNYTNSLLLNIYNIHT